MRAAKSKHSTLNLIGRRLLAPIDRIARRPARAWRKDLRDQIWTLLGRPQGEERDRALAVCLNMAALNEALNGDYKLATNLTLANLSFHLTHQNPSSVIVSNSLINLARLHARRCEWRDFWHLIRWLSAWAGGNGLPDIWPDLLVLNRETRNRLGALTASQETSNWTRKVVLLESSRGLLACGQFDALLQISPPELGTVRIAKALTQEATMIALIEENDTRGADLAENWGRAGHGLHSVAFALRLLSIGGEHRLRNDGLNTDFLVEELVHSAYSPNEHYALSALYLVDTVLDSLQDFFSSTQRYDLLQVAADQADRLDDDVFRVRFGYGTAPVMSRAEPGFWSEVLVSADLASI